MENTIPVFIVEAFMVGHSASSHTGTGNPAAVCILQCDDEIPDETKQKIASTLNLSVTAFVSKGWSENSKLFNDKLTLNTEDPFSAPENHMIQRTLRWFTPTTEIALCGHATIATAKALLLSENEAPLDPFADTAEKLPTVFKFESKLRGILPVTVTNTKPDSDLETEEEITLTFPACETTRIDITNSSWAIWISAFTRQLLGPLFYLYQDSKNKESTPSATQSSAKFLEDVQYSEKEKIILFRLKRQEGEHPEKTIGKVTPNFQKLMETTGMGFGIVDALCTHAIIVTIGGADTCSGNSSNHGNVKGDENEPEQEPDFYSRFFAPYYGIDEDSVTGIAHTILTPYWTKELCLQGKVLWARQASARGGDLHCFLNDEVIDGKIQSRVTLSGRARVVLKGELYV